MLQDANFSQRFFTGLTLNATNSFVPPACVKVIIHLGVASFGDKENTSSESGSIFKLRAGMVNVNDYVTFNSLCSLLR